MVSITKKPQKITQASSSVKNHYKQWGNHGKHNLSPLKTGKEIICGYHKDSPAIAGKTGTYRRPAPLTFSNFGFNIPKNSTINKIVIKYYDQNPKYHGAYGKFTAPTIKLNKGKAKKSQAVKREYTLHTIVINALKEKWAIKDVNNLKFTLSYPTNSTTNETRLWFKNLTVQVQYTEPKYNLLVENIPTQVDLHKTFDLKFKITNTSKVNYNPRVKINIPPGLSYEKRIEGKGSIIQEEGDSFVVWDPEVSDKKLESEVTLRFNTNLKGVHEITAQTQETKYSSLVTASINVVQNLSLSVLTPPELNIKDNENVVFSLKAETDTFFENSEKVNVLVKGDADTQPNQVKFELQKDLDEYTDITSEVVRSEIEDETEGIIYQYSWTPTFTTENLIRILRVTIKPAPDTHIGQINTQTYFSEEQICDYPTHITPSGIGEVKYTGIILDDTETKPMQNGVAYIAQANLYINDSNNHYIEEIPDLGVNHRIGVYNKNPHILFEDRNGHQGTWVNNGFDENIIIQDNSRTILVPTKIDATYTSDLMLSSLEDYSIEFAYYHNHYPYENEKPFDMSDKKIKIGNDTYSFERLGITNTCYVKLVIKNQVLSVIISDEETQIGAIPDLPFKYNISFQAGESKSSDYDESLTFAMFQISSLSKTYTSDELIEHAYQNMDQVNWSPVVSKSNTWTHQEVLFSYDETAPVVVLLTGEPANYYKNDVNLMFTQPVIHEDSLVEEEPNTFFDEEDPNFLQPLDFIRTNGSASVSGNSNEMVFYNFEELHIPNSVGWFFTGIGVRFDCSGENEVTVLASIDIDGEEGNRSAVIDFEEDENDEDEEEVYDSDDLSPEDSQPRHMEIGGRYDRWGLDFEDFQAIDTLEVSLTMQGNNLDDIGSISINNLRVVVYYNQVDYYPYSVFVEGVDTRNYGMFIKDIKIPAGVNTENKYLRVEGTDVNKPYNMSVKSKQITIDFDIEGTPADNTTEDGLIDAAAQLKQLTKLFMNERTAFNKPILKTIRFSHYPGEYFEYIMENSIDNQAVIDSFAGSIVLNIPSGVSYSDKVISTGAYGANKGLLSVKPVITVTNLRSHNIRIIENESNTRMIIRDDSLENALKFDSDDYIEINCEDRNCVLYKWRDDSETYEEHDIDESVDFLSDWFVINSEYSFSCDGATVYRVEFQEKG